jgi:acetyltransferase-like isoleucine patch superfamily enzyme
MAFVHNPWRRSQVPRRPRLLHATLRPITRLGLLCGFAHVDYAYVQGDRRRLHLGENCSVMNTVFNVVSGDVYVGDDTLFSHNCLVLTGTHRYFQGRRVNLQPAAPYPEVPTEGRDVRIGRGCFIAGGAAILGGVELGDNVVIGAGAVVATDIPEGCFAAGVPARVISRNDASPP